MISNINQLKDYTEIRRIMYLFNRVHGNWYSENNKGQCTFYCELYHEETKHLDAKVDEFCKLKRAQNSDVLNPYKDYIVGNDGRIYLSLNHMSRTARLEVLDVSYYEDCDEIFEYNEAEEDKTNESYGRALVTTNLKFIREFCEYVLANA